LMGSLAEIYKLPGNSFVDRPSFKV